VDPRRHSAIGLHAQSDVNRVIHQHFRRLKPPVVSIAAGDPELSPIEADGTIEAQVIDPAFVGHQAVAHPDRQPDSPGRPVHRQASPDEIPVAASCLDPLASINDRRIALDVEEVIRTEMFVTKSISRVQAGRSDHERHRWPGWPITVVQKETGKVLERAFDGGQLHKGHRELDPGVERIELELQRPRRRESGRVLGG
jgi:hypothetical protein